MEVEVKKTTKPEAKLVSLLTALEEEAFGKGGLHNPWLLVPFIRHGRIYVLYIDKEPAGVAEFMRDWEDSRKVYLFGISMASKFRGKGLGKAFLRIILEKIREEGWEKVELTVRPESYVQRLYSEFCFEEREVLPDEYGPGEDRIAMELKLQ